MAGGAQLERGTGAEGEAQAGGVEDAEESFELGVAFSGKELVQAHPGQRRQPGGFGKPARSGDLGQRSEDQRLIILLRDHVEIARGLFWLFQRLIQIIIMAAIAPHKYSVYYGLHIVKSLQQQRRLLGRGQLAAEFAGQGADHFVGGDPDGLFRFLQRVFHYRAVLVPAQDYADGRVLVGGFHLVVQHG